jgi:hypothetical protein
MDKRSRLDLIHGYQDWIQDYVDQDWDPYEILFMYRPLPGGKQSILEQMKREIYRVNSRLVTRFDRDPRSEAGFNRLPSSLSDWGFDLRGRGQFCVKLWGKSRHQS